MRDGGIKADLSGRGASLLGRSREEPGVGVEQDHATARQAAAAEGPEVCAPFASYATHTYESPFMRHAMESRTLERTAVRNYRDLRRQGFADAASADEEYRYELGGVFPGWIKDHRDFGQITNLVSENQLREALRTHPSLRSEKQLDRVVKYIKRVWESAKGLSDDRLKSLARCVTYTVQSRGDTIVKEGDIGYTFHILMSGTATISRADHGLIKELESGSSFGETALSAEGVLRTATVTVCSAEAELLMIYKSDYDKLIRSIFAERKVEALKLLRSMPLFANWPRSRVERIVGLLHRTPVQAGETICRQHDRSDYMWFIVSGRVRVFKEIMVTSTNRWPKGARQWEERMRKSTSRFDLVDLGPGAYFGEKSILHHTGRGASAEAVEDTVLLALEAGDFLNLVARGTAMELVDRQAKGYARDEEVLQLFNALNLRMKQRSLIKNAILHHSQAPNGVEDLQHSKTVSSLPTDYSRRTQDNEWMVSVQAGAEASSPASAATAAQGLPPIGQGHKFIRRSSAARVDKVRSAISRRLSVGRHGADAIVLRAMGAERRVRVRRRQSVLGDSAAGGGEGSARAPRQRGR